LHLGKQCQFPPLVEVKDFFRWVISKTTGLIDEEEGRPTLDTLKSIGENFFAGFTRYTEVKVSEEDRSEVYNVSQGHIDEIKRQS
jgi:hypothetical protein